MLRTRILVLLVVALSLSCTTVSGADRGHLVLNGGGSKPDVVMEKFIELAGGPSALIVVFPTASSERDTGEYYQDLLAGYGCTNVSVADVRDRQDAGDLELAAVVRSAGGIFFSGGDQRRITEALLGTAVGDAVVDAFNGGAAVGGTSAGTACQSGKMITGDGDFTVITADNIEMWDGLGLFEGVIVDQHFVARKRHNRLMSVVLENPQLLGVGVDEGTAVWVRPNGTFEVLGDGWVIVYDASEAEIRRRPYEHGGEAMGAVGMKTHILLPGDIFDIERRRLEIMRVKPR